MKVSYGEKAKSLDKYDKKILEYLQEDGSISNLELSKRIGLAPSSCLLRTKALEDDGIIAKRSIIIDEKKLGYDIVAFARVEITKLTREVSDNFIKVIRDIPQVVECYTITGDGSFLLKVVARDLREYRDFVIDKIMSIDHVSNVVSSLVAQQDKTTTVIPLN
ncbi:MAG: Lrp/AsnC family transcriptional regulator [Acholeplasmatales bacterium]|nr:Lrp/AsnC family transcriptional regulator [Acholeplasmatales bacterium]